MQLLSVITEPHALMAEMPSKADIFNKQTLDKYLKGYKASFNRVFLWVKMRQQIANLITTQSKKSRRGKFLKNHDATLQSSLNSSGKLHLAIISCRPHRQYLTVCVFFTREMKIVI